MSRRDSTGLFRKVESFDESNAERAPSCPFGRWKFKAIVWTGGSDKKVVWCQGGRKNPIPNLTWQ